MKLSQEQCNILLDWLENNGHDVDKDMFEAEFLVAKPAKISKHDFDDFMSYIVQEVCEHTGMSREDFFLKAHCRLRKYVVARSYFYWIVGAETPYISLQKVGVFAGGKDHASVIHNRKTLIQRCETDKSLYNDLFNLCEKLEDAGYYEPKQQLLQIQPIWNRDKQNWLRA